MVMRDILRGDRQHVLKRRSRDGGRTAHVYMYAGACSDGMVSAGTAPLGMDGRCGYKIVEREVQTGVGIGNPVQGPKRRLSKRTKKGILLLVGGV